jgi:hypothetical protein
MMEFPKFSSGTYMFIDVKKYYHTYDNDSII